MLPKIIHYCWFGKNPLPQSAKKSIASWRKFLPDYEIKEWNESNFDVYQCQFVREAYNSNKYAFVADYARLYVLFKYGGIYFDTDVEVLKSFTCFEKFDFFIGLEMEGQVGTSVIGAKASHPLIKAFLHYYSIRPFILQDGSLDKTPNTVIISKMMRKHGYVLENTCTVVDHMAIFPKDYFSPVNMLTEELEVTDNTYSIHHFTGSWQSPKERLKFKAKAIFRRFVKKMR